MKGIELTPEEPVADVVDLGVRAEQAGFDTVLSASHYFNRDPFIVLDRVGAATREVRIGPAAANPYDTHPVVLAARMATLQETTRGRAVFGVGPGDRSTLAALGIERDRPLRRVLETITTARDLWSGGAVSTDGTFTTTDATLEFDVETPIPVYVGAQGPHMLRMGAKYADGVLVNAAHHRDFEWAASELERGRADRVHTTRLDVVGYVSVSIAEDETDARDAARPPVAFIAAGASDDTLDRHDIDHDRAADIGDYIGAGRLRDAFSLVTPAMIDAFCIAGTTATVRDRFASIRPHTDGIVCAAPLGPDPRSAIPRLARAVDGT